MLFLDTQPFVGDDVLDEFRVHAPAELRSLLKQIVDGNVLVSLNGSDGTAYTTTIWTLDPTRGVMTLAADAHDPRLQALLEADEIVVVAYLDSIKLQFDLAGAMLVHGGRSSALQAELPRVLYRFQRRGSYRVRPLARSSPLARFAHPARPELALALRVLDVSLGGCALLLPADAPPLEPGTTIARAAIELDLETRFEARLTLHHVTAMNPGSGGQRLGCSMGGLAPVVERDLQRYIDQTQKRRRSFVLEL